ncbi:DNA invertase Pin-like site-specific DNA recombinase [Arthrobacter sp. UYEF20]
MHSMDRLALTLDDLRFLVKRLTTNGVRIEVIKEQLVFMGTIPRWQT